MAEFVVSKLAESVVSQTVQTVSELLIHDAASLRRVREDVVLLQDELKSLVGFVKDADSKQEHDQRLRDLVIQVKDVASDAEDVIETFILKVITSSSIKKPFHNKRIRTEINFVRTRIQGIFRSMNVYGINSVNNVPDQARTGHSSMVELQRNLRRSFPNDDGDDEESNGVISLEGSISMVALTAELSKEEDRLCIVSVVGMGGLGKTTLAKKVFNGVKQHFDSSAWVFISQRHAPKDVLIEILTQLYSSFENTTKFGKKKCETPNNLQLKKEHELIGLVKEELKEKRYLVVLDDIWRIEAWDSIKRAFPKGNKGSKILFTTRNREVATSADPLSTPIEPPLLTMEQSWELLHRKAFPREINVGQQEFDKLGKEMAKKCGGLPLALVVLGGLLRTKNSVDQWKNVLSDVNSNLNKLHSRQQYEGVHEILALSYHDLPYNLKPCFLYLANFPEDYKIHKKRLVRLWIGEGFVHKPTRGDAEQTLEEVAEGYLKELIHRCMVQVDKRDHTGIGVKTCRVHDLIRDLCILKAKDESFVQIFQQHGQMNTENTLADDFASFQHLAGTNHSRRVAIHSGSDLEYCNPHWVCSLIGKPTTADDASWLQQLHPNLRSVVCLGGTISISALKLNNFKMLRVLELHITVGSNIPGGIGNLIHLRYLRLSNKIGKIKLPPTIGNLRNLQTFDLRNCSDVKLQKTMSRLTRLRHLLLPSRFWEFPGWIHFRLDELKDIVTLNCVPSSALIRYEALNKLTNLRNLGIKFEGSDDDDDDVRRVMESHIVKSGCLRSLDMLSNVYGFSSLESLSSCHSLSRLSLEGKILGSPSLGFLPASLSKLTMWYSNMEKDPMPVLEKLPNLRFLILGFGSFCGSEMVCSTNGFTKLETLELRGLFSLRHWSVKNGAMQSLKKLEIVGLLSLEKIPKGLEFVTTLKELNIEFMSKSFCEKLEANGGVEGEDYHKVRHILSVTIKFRT